MQEVTLTTIAAIGVIVSGWFVSSYWMLYGKYQKLKSNYKTLDQFNELMYKEYNKLLPIRDEKGRFVKRIK